MIFPAALFCILQIRGLRTAKVNTNCEWIDRRWAQKDIDWPSILGPEHLEELMEWFEKENMNPEGQWEVEVSNATDEKDVKNGEEAYGFEKGHMNPDGLWEVEVSNDTDEEEVKNAEEAVTDGETLGRSIF